MRARLLGKSPSGVYLRANEWLWRRLPRRLTASRPATTYARGIHALARLGERRMTTGTFFFRNRPQLDLIRTLAAQSAIDGVTRLAVIGCSLGAEVYSIRFALGTAHPELELRITAVDIAPEIVEAARAGVYGLGVSEVARTALLERLTEAEIDAMFVREADVLTVKPDLREGIRWETADAGDPRIVEAIGQHELVVANDFLCHMDPAEAERCLRNLARLVTPGGHLVVSGVDLDVRTRVARALGWRPVHDSIEEIHEGDPVLRWGWPWGYWGLEPLDRSRDDWTVRYASVFQLEVAR